MNIWKHSLLSEKKFGGKASDYYAIHQFLDESKYFYFHLKHRILLHNTFGINLCVKLFGDVIENSDQQTIMVRDIAAEHCKEDLSGKVPTIIDWFQENQHLSDKIIVLPEIEDPVLSSFVYAPLLQSNIKASMIITCSDFGVFLIEKFFGLEKARTFREKIPVEQNVKAVLSGFKFTERWQFTPNMKELDLLK